MIRPRAVLGRGKVARLLLAGVCVGRVPSLGSKTALVIEFKRVILFGRDAQSARDIQHVVLYDDDDIVNTHSLLRF